MSDAATCEAVNNGSSSSSRRPETCPCLPHPHPPHAPQLPLNHSLEDEGAGSGEGGQRDRCVGAAEAHMAEAQVNMAVALFVNPPPSNTLSSILTDLPLLQIPGLLLDEIYDFMERVKGVLRPLIFRLHGGRRHSSQGNFSGDLSLTHCAPCCLSVLELQVKVHRLIILHTHILHY